MNFGTQFGVQAIEYLLVHLVALVITWWAFLSFKLELFVRDPQSARAKILFVFMTVAVSSLVSDFFLNYLNWSLRLPLLFH